MRSVLFIAAGAAALAAAPAVAQPSAQGVTTATLAEACASGEGRGITDAAAVGYCRGFMAGAGQYHREISTDRPAIFCLPEPSPSFEAAQASFVAWVRANPRFAGEQAVDGLMRWAAATFPCPTAPTASAGRGARR